MLARKLIVVLCTILPATNVCADVDFAHDVLPVLKKHCAKCHTNGTYKSAFSMDTRSELVESGHVEPGDAETSEMIRRITSDDLDERMPPKGTAVTEAEVAKLREWINSGLKWEAGFSFKQNDWESPVRHRRVELPPGDGEPIDRIVLKYFSEHEILPPRPVSDSTFLRRVYLDLIGTLPTETETNVFLYDANPNKRAALISDLLERNEAYAAHWMTFWNDLLRNDYAGTGYIDGGRKQITGWLFASLLENKPYDQFVRELIEGKKEAEGFIRGIKWRGNVNASQVRELQFAQNVSQVFLGENIKCASCHDSFINNWKLKDAYGMAAIIAERELELHRCDKATGEKAVASWLFPELGNVDSHADKNERLRQTAALMVGRENGRFARTIVNRIWQRLMGRGLVEPVDIMSKRPWSEDLLDYLADDFAATGFDLKQLLVKIASSATYQARSVEPFSGPADNFVFQGPVARRMTAEQFVDAVWTITGTLPKKRDAGVHVPSDAEVDAAKEDSVRAADGEQQAPEVAVSQKQDSRRKRKLIRASLVRSTLLMRALGRPNREQVVTTRPAELSTLQALELNNGKEFVGLLGSGAKRFEAMSSEELVRSLFMQCLCRLPSDEERAIAFDILGDSHEGQGTVDLLWMVFMLPEFQLIN